MRLKLSLNPVPVHTEIVTCVGWSATNELLTCSDDKTIQRWSKVGEPCGKVCTVDTYLTSMHWFPSKRAQPQSDVFVVGATDGAFLLINGAGRIEKKVENAHTGAVCCVRWNFEGTSLLTAGEDGVMKVWSRSGMLRSTLQQIGRPIYSMAWNSNNDKILFTWGRDLAIKPLHPTSKQIQWRAHDAPILQVDWNPVTSLIVSGGEDCKYKVWDAFGKLLFCSRACESMVTAVAWCPDGELFAVGSYNTLRLCDKTGWSYSREAARTGSLFSIAWTSDGTQLAAGGGCGAVALAVVVDRRLSWNKVEAVLDDPLHISIRLVDSDLIENLNFPDRVIKMALNFEHLVVATSTQCYVYSTSNWHSPCIFDLKDSVNLIVQSPKHFLMADHFNGLQVYSYEGRLVCSPKHSGIRCEFLSALTLSLNKDYVAVVDASDTKCVHVFQLKTGKVAGMSLQHSMEVSEIYLDQSAGGSGSEAARLIAFVDKNRDLYISPVLTLDLQVASTGPSSGAGGVGGSSSSSSAVKLASVTSSCSWNDQTNMLAAIVDQQFVVWFYPNVVYVDRDLLPKTRFSNNLLNFGKSATILQFFGNECTVRREDGAVLTTSVSPYPLMLYEYCDAAAWEPAVRLCRFVKDSVMWACLATMAVQYKHLNTAEVALAAIEEVDKLQYIAHIKDIPSVEGRNAALCLYKRQDKEAENILIQAGLYYRAIKCNISLFKWTRALKIAVKFRTHVDTVLAYRQRHLEQYGLPETDPLFLKYKDGVEINWANVKLKVNNEKEAERSRGLSQ